MIVPLGVAFLLMIVNILLVSLSPLVGLALVVISTVLISRVGNRFLAIFILVNIFFANPIVSISSGFIESRAAFDIVRGVDFLVLSISFVLAILSYLQVERGKYILLACGILFLYFLLGVVQVGFSSAAIYLRYFMYPVMLWVVFRVLLNGRDEFFGYALSIWLVYVAWIAFEYLSPVGFLELWGFEDFANYKFKKYFSSLEHLISLREVKIIDYEGISIYSVRLYGPVFHTITSAYILAIFSIYAFMRTDNALFIFVGVLALLLLLSKGAILFYGATILLISGVRVVKSRFYAQGVLLSYLTLTVFLVWLGLETNNPHHYSLMSAIYNLPSKLLGGGLGNGGSISTGTEYSTEIGESSGDSAMALFINMLGLLGAILYLYLLYFTYRKAVSGERNETAFFGAIFFLLCNGVSQEEAISPYVISALFLSGEIYKWRFDFELNKKIA